MDYFSLAPSSYEIFGSTGLILAVMIIITLPLMAITSGIAMVIFILLGVIFASALTLLTSGSIIGVGSVVMWLICAGIILIVRLNSRRHS